MFPFNVTARKMKFPIKDFFSKCNQIRRKLRIWSNLLKKPLVENFIFLCSVPLKTLEKQIFSDVVREITSKYWKEKC